MPTRIIYTVLALIPYIRNLEKNMNQLFPDSVGEYNKRKKKKISSALWSFRISTWKHFPRWKTKRGAPKDHSSFDLIWEEGKKSQAEMARSFGIWYQGEEKYAD